jgi:beta-N-acetylhexosaminidase
MRIGELFILGFRGKQIPDWLREFERKFGLGGVILFDYNCQTRSYENNIESPEQVKRLCSEISALPSRPLIFVDQEGGKVRRLKERAGFAPLPSAQNFAKLTSEQQLAILEKSFGEMRKLGIHYTLAPVIDLNFNPDNPDIGKVERSYSRDPSVVNDCVTRIHQVASMVGLGLCLKHFPGMGGARVNSHLELTDISDSIAGEQLDLFWQWGNKIHGQAILVSHGIIQQWDPHTPATLSPYIIQKIRTRLPNVLLISDDIQMQGAQKAFGSETIVTKGLEAGLDMICVGNNLLAEDGKYLAIADKLQPRAAEFSAALARVCERKRQFTL